MILTSLPFIIVSLCLFILGAVLGSFLNVLVYRSVREKDWVRGRSQCEDCGRPIAWYDNIPLLSFILLQGKCRHCKQTIGLTHPVVEFLMGSLFVWWYWGGTFFFKLTEAPFTVIQPVFWLIISIILLFIFITDLLYFLILDSSVVALLIVTVMYRSALLVNGILQPIDFIWALVGAVLASGFFGLLWFFTKGKGMGFGDVKLMIPISLLVGWPHVIVTIFTSFVLGATVGIVLILFGKKKFGQHIPFGPFIISATGIVLIWGDELIRWYLSFL